MPNFLLASAPYGHGEGGAGKRGSRRIFGGHSHVGTLMYLGDNWPDRFRNHLFSINLHGHQINHQANRRLGSGFETVHGGSDVFYCPDPQFVGVDLQTGPDGAVYIIDWVDRQHCHNPNEEQWDRSNGRLYRLSYRETWKPASVDLSSLSDQELIGLHKHPNDWFVRHARRLLQERAAANSLADDTVERLRKLTLGNAETRLTLRYLWALHAVGGLTDTIVTLLLAEPDEFIRAWTIQLATENGEPSRPVAEGMLDLAELAHSATVRLYLAAAVPRLEDKALAWELVERLVARGEDKKDPNIPKMLWFALAELLENDAERALALAESSPIQELREFTYWYVSKPGVAQNGLALLTSRLSGSPAEQQRNLLEKMAAALRGGTSSVPYATR